MEKKCDRMCVPARVICLLTNLAETAFTGGFCMIEWRYFYSSRVKLSIVMSKKNKKIVNSLTGWGHGYVVSANTPNVIIGNVLTLVEILGLSEKQEQPFKDLIRQKIWDQFNNDGVGISEETHTKIRDAYYEEMNRARNLNQPPSLG